MIVIGITGTLGAGKGTIVDYLVKHHGFAHYSVRGFLTQIIQSRGLDLNRDTMVAVANELREKNGPSYIAEALFREAGSSGKDCIIESIRTMGEVLSLRSKGPFYLIAVDADQKLRYERIIQRASETDRISFETFAENEAREMNSDDLNKQNLSACMKAADFVFENNGGFEALYTQVDRVLEKIKNR